MTVPAVRFCGLGGDGDKMTYFFRASLRFLNLPSDDTSFWSLSIKAFVWKELEAFTNTQHAPRPTCQPKLHGLPSGLQDPSHSARHGTGCLRGPLESGSSPPTS